MPLFQPKLKYAFLFQVFIKTYQKRHPQVQAATPY
jgi:hypothetical protein